jgi:GNAT superfamily N-acetyltransferase
VPTPADAPAAQSLIRELDADIVARDPGGSVRGLHPGEHRDPRLRFYVLTVGGEPAGCGALRALEPGVAELKRMFLRPGYRGRGLSRVVLTLLEQEARRGGVRLLRLETGPHQVEALGLYRSAGYTDVPRYGEYVDSPTSICLQKTLPEGGG